MGYVLNGYVWDMCGVMDMCGICVGYVWCEICVGYVWCEIRQQSSEEPCDETSFGKNKKGETKKNMMVRLAPKGELLVKNPEPKGPRKKQIILHSSMISTCIF